MTKRIPGARLSLPVKLTLLAVSTHACVLWALVAIVDATRDSDATTRTLLLALPLVPQVFVVWVLGHFVVGRLTTPVISAYRQLAEGDFGAELPPMTAGSDFVALREAFYAMKTALARSLDEVRAADLDRRRLFADLAHELATPTTTLMGIAEALRQGMDDAPRLLDHLEHECARLERLIADVREVAHLEDPSLPLAIADRDVGELARRAVDRARLGAGNACALACDAEPATAAIDALRIDQVLTNLLNNAIRHAGGGRVQVTVRAAATGAELLVEDSGTGVPDELLPQLGRRLLRIDASRSRDTGGHGLGLAIVRAIVQRHGGEVSFERATLGGLAARVTLPREHPE